MKHTKDPHQAKRIARQTGQAVLYMEGEEFDILLDEHTGDVYKQKRP